LYNKTMSGLLGLLSKKKFGHVIALDIGSYSIKTAVFETTSDGEQISSVNKKIFYLPLFAEGEGLVNSKITVSRIREIIFNFLKELKRVPNKIIIGFDMPLAEPKIETFKTRIEKSKKDISKDELDGLFNSLIEEENKKLADQGKKIILARPISIFLNGYEIKKFELGLYGEDVAFKALISYIDFEVADDFLAITQMLGGIPVEFSSTIFNLGRAVPQKIPTGKECVILDIGGLCTNLIIIINGVINEIASFSSGGYNFTRSLSREIGMEVNQSNQLEKQYALGLATSKEAEKIAGVFTEESAAWEEKFIGALDSMAQTDFFPKKIYLTGGGANIPEIKKVLEAKRWVSHVLYSGEADITTLGAEDILGKDQFASVLKGSSEAGLAALMVNLNS